MKNDIIIKKIALVFFSCFLLLLNIINVTAEFEDIKFGHIKTIDGLSHDTVYSIIQDKNGLIWIGTEDGLNKYNGYEIEILRGDKSGGSIGNANISTLVVDNENQIWIASWGGGLQVLNSERNNVKIYKNDPLIPDSISDNYVHSIFNDSKGNIWVGTYTQGLNLLKPNSESFEIFKHDENDINTISHNRIWWINEDSDGNILLGTNSGLDKYDPINNLFTHYEEVKSRVRTIYWDRNQMLWLGTQTGLCQFDLNTLVNNCYTNTFNSTNSNVITSIYEDSFNNFWVGTSDGLYLFDRLTSSFTRYSNDENNPDSLSNNDIRVIFEDESKNLWVGTRGGGINKFDIKPSKFKTYNTSSIDSIQLSDNYVYSLLFDKNQNLWVGTNNGGLNKFDVNGQKTILMDDITQEINRNISSMIEDDNSIWVGSLGGLSKLDLVNNVNKIYTTIEEDETSLSNNTVTSLLKNSEGQIWIGTINGLNLYNKELDNFTRFVNDQKNENSISSNSIQVLFEDSSSRFWIGTSSGLNLMDLEENTFKRYLYQNDIPNSISDNIIHDIFEDSNRNIWIATQYGLNKYDEENDNFTIFTIDDGLPNNTIKSIQEDKNGNLWISTNKGISNYIVNDNLFINYDSFDGLQGSGYNKGASEVLLNNEIVFGGVNGIDIIDVDLTYKNQFLPKLYIISFLINGEKYSLNEELNEIKLNYEQKNLYIEMASLDYTHIERNQFAYMLEGYDEDWTYLGNRNIINYTNLPSGDYVLRIKSSNSDGVWNEKAFDLNISISPPWWANNIAYIIYFLLIVFIVHRVFRFYINRQIRKNETLQDMLKNSINVMSKIGEIRDIYTVGHQKRVQQLSVAIARECKLTNDQIINIEFGAMIHDIGKISVATEYLNKPGRLSDIEYQIIQTHVESGCKIIEDIKFPIEVHNIVAQHHERLDGTGYPNGLKGSEICIESRIVSVADVVEAMCNNRPYRPAVGINAALEEIDRFKGTKYDSNIVEICIKLFKEKNFKFQDN